MIAGCRRHVDAGDVTAVVIVLGGGVCHRRCPGGGDGGCGVDTGAGVER